jgi:hypothetical protein
MLPRYGPNSVKRNNEKLVPYIEVKEGTDPY